MLAEIHDLINWLNQNRKKNAPYNFEEVKRYWRIICNDGAAYAFIVKDGFQNKKLGRVVKGDIMMPATFGQPAKHVRGSLFDKKTWFQTFGEWGVKRLK